MTLTGFATVSVLMFGKLIEWVWLKLKPVMVHDPARPGRVPVTTRAKASLAGATRVHPNGAASLSNNARVPDGNRELSHVLVILPARSAAVREALITPHVTGRHVPSATIPALAPEVAVSFVAG
jgi:hypothetical protein